MSLSAGPSHAETADTGSTSPAPAVALQPLNSPRAEDDEASANDAASSATAGSRSAPDTAAAVAAPEAAPAPQKSRAYFTSNPDSWYYKLVHSPTFALAVVGMAILVDTLVYSIIIPILPFIFENLGYPVTDSSGKSSSTLIGVMIAIFGIGILVSSPAYGILSDRYKNRRWPMVVGLAVQIIAILAFMWANSLGLLYFARFLQGVAGASIWTIGLAFISDIFPEHELGRAMSSVFLGLNIGALIGPVIGGILYEYLGYRAPFIFNCVAIAIDMFLRILVAEPDHSVERAHKKGFGTTDTRTPKEKDATTKAEEGDSELKDKESEALDNKDTASVATAVPPRPERTLFRTTLAWSVVTKPVPSFLDLIKDPCVLLMCWLTVVGGVGFGTLEASAPLHLSAEPFNASPATIGLVFLALVIPNSISAIVSGFIRDKYGSKWILYVGLLVTAVTIPLLAVPGNYAGFCVVFAVYGIVSAAAVCPSLPELSILVPESVAGRVYALFNITFSIGIVVGPLIGGALYSVSTFAGLPNNGRMMGPGLVIGIFNFISLPLMYLYFWLKEERDQIEAMVKWDTKYGGGEMVGNGETGKPMVAEVAAVANN